ncbi:MAG: hypothetical protein LBP23_07085 [Treponema sp.]|jgi:hypothetical protein|nr:hypothetical protein [Treponema sp.]
MGLLRKAAEPARGSLLRKIQQRAERAALSSNLPPLPSQVNSDEVGRFLQGRGSFQGIVLKLPSGTEKERFVRQTEKILSSLGSVCSLSPQSCLVLVSVNTDSELLAHRLSQSLKVRVLHRFRTDTLKEALEQLSPYRS